MSQLKVKGLLKDNSSYLKEEIKTNIVCWKIQSMLGCQTLKVGTTWPTHVCARGIEYLCDHPKL